MNLKIIKFILFLFLLLQAASLLIPLKDIYSKPLYAYDVNDVSFNYKTTKTFDKAELLEVMLLPKIQVFNQDELEKDRQRLKKFYFDNGFFDAIIDTMVTYDNINKEVDIEIIIYEKERYTVRELLIVGLDNKIPDKLKSDINTDRLLKSGDNYTKSAVAKESNRILDILQNNGYLKAQIDPISGTVIAKYSPEVQKNPSYKNKVRITLKFSGVDRTYNFGKTKIKIADNKYRLDQSIIEREIKYKEGDLYSRDQLVQSERNLTKIALIQLGRIQIDTVLESTGTVELVTNIMLTTKYQVTPSILGSFIDNYFYLGAGLTYDDKNFFGGGRVLSLSVEPLFHSKDVNQVSVSANLFQPYLFSDNITANFKVSAIYFNLNEFYQGLSLTNSLILNYNLRKYTFYNNLSTELNADLNRLKIKQDVVIDTGMTITTIPAGTITNSMNSVLGFTATHNNTNSVFNPSSGFFHAITLEEAGILPALLNKISRNIDYSQYFKFYLQNYFYFDLSSLAGNRVLGIASRIGDIMEFGSGDNIVPVLPQYKFFSGGGNSVRGWYAQKNGVLENTQNGGKFLFEGSFEYRWMPFVGSTGFTKDLGTIFFLDYGNVWETHKQFRFNEIALAIGFGFRYYTFVGPVRIDVGFKLYDPSAEAGSQWLFSDIKKIFSPPQKWAIQFGLGNAF